MSSAYAHLHIERHDDGYGVVTLNRPEALNALNSAILTELAAYLDAVEQDERVRCIILTGSSKAFAAGADVREMAGLDYPEMYLSDYLTAAHERITRFRKPIIAAVAGFALGGGCELAMMCDIIIAADTARFGQPEVTLGVAPGLGGSQRLTRAIGKAKAMDMVLTARTMGAEEAERAGLVSRVVAASVLLDEARKVAAQIAAQSLLALLVNKEMVNTALSSNLSEGLRFERRLFHSLFAFDDQKEGMGAFIDKRRPQFRDR